MSSTHGSASVDAHGAGAAAQAGMDIPNLDDLAKDFPPMSSPSAGASHSIGGIAAVPAMSPSAAVAAAPYLCSEYTGKLVEGAADGSQMRWSYHFIGQWNIGGDNVTSGFQYNFSTATGHRAPVHPDGSHPRFIPLPSTHAHAMLGVRFEGSYNFKTVDQATGQYAEQQIHEPVTKNKASAPMTMRLGGSVPDVPAAGLPDPLSRMKLKTGLEGPKEDFLGITGDGSNPILGSIKWVGVYHPSTGQMYMCKYWRNHAQPIPRAKSVPKPRPEGVAGAGAGTSKRSDPALADAARYEQDSQHASAMKTAQPHVDKLTYGEGVYEALPFQIRFLETVFKEVRNNKAHFPTFFISPVDVMLFPSYPTVVKQPMCLDDVQRKLEAGSYSTAEQFSEDMHLIFKNAKAFTPDVRAPVHALADSLEAELGRSLKRYRASVSREEDKIALEQEKSRAEEMKQKKKVEEAAEKARKEAERAAIRAEAAERAASRPKAPVGVKRPRKPEGEGGAPGEDGDGDGESRAGDDDMGEGAGVSQGAAGSSGAEAGSSATPVAVSAPAPAKKRKTGGDSHGHGHGGGGHGRSVAGGADISTILSSLSTVTDAIKTMAEMQAKFLQAQTAGAGMMNPQASMMMANMHAMQGVLGAAVGPLSQAVQAPHKPRGKPRGPKKLAEEDTGSQFVSGEELDAYLDAEARGRGRQSHRDADGDDDDFKSGRARSKSKGAAPSSGKAEKRQPKALDPSSLPLTEEEKHKLSEDVSSLPADDTERVLQMLVERNLVQPNAEGEVELDMNTIPTSTLRELQRIVAEKLGRAIPHANPAAGEKRGPGRPAGSGTYAGGASQRAETIAAVARVAEANMDRISALGTLGMSSNPGYGGFDGDDLPPPPPP